MGQRRIGKLIAGFLVLSLGGVAFFAVSEEGISATHAKRTFAQAEPDAAAQAKPDAAAQVKSDDATETKSDVGPQEKQNGKSADLDKPLVSYLRSVKTCPVPTQDEIATAQEEIRSEKRKIPEDVKLHGDAWLWYSQLFRYLNYGISMAVVFFGALAAALKDEDQWYKRWKTMAAILATVAAGANTAFQPYTDFKKFDDAWVVLHTMKTEYLTNPEISVCEFSRAIAYGETIIHRGE